MKLNDRIRESMEPSSQPPKPSDAVEWYSIKEAAKYLNVGEPTLYRWMRDGKITYRKVGDSTRFLKQDLDAVVEIYPSAKD
ncbi:MAG: helix-turn-helix domain-containing protein, partial [Acidobacteria bacterium]|nr:helix-turn-helix domain-containing protein [Acidobacteriota bacterium]